MEITSIALFCGSATGNSNKYCELARELGHYCATHGITIYYGGACIGLMGEAARACLDSGGNVIGIAPGFFAEGAVLSQDLPEMILVQSMSERKQQFEALADAFVILPGSYGTMDEFFEVITDAQLGLHNKPVAILNAFGYYDHLLAQLEHFKTEGFLRSFHYDLLLISDNIPSLFAKIHEYEYGNDRNWLDKIKK
ncbi:TIGR00730 family Rossman fold protein [Bacteroidales bacterium OttesenSCG-928-B11]|nr:TIGR00730 family Rossman fold protein [Bacteroidales bacterium OttesenSCG-928-E04]MDL2309265.1 TIGR00730 family Rossman fold protein [Bacteroidales bacterium OttesenSCG-928-C03]MDL2312345.1 TIGR00730 family Rossman fold protein [Bacteroidales bacterium OttesenSCG-928-B11]MDL2326291.1 TIGR00730 family Rossman fold protein [Bacteroidales bacterium OttesenSCG-928-A14]